MLKSLVSVTDIFLFHEGYKLLKVIPLKLSYYQTFLKLGVINIHDMNIKKLQ